MSTTVAIATGLHVVCVLQTLKTNMFNVACGHIMIELFERLNSSAQQGAMPGKALLISCTLQQSSSHTLCFLFWSARLCDFIDLMSTQVGLGVDVFI